MAIQKRFTVIEGIDCVELEDVRQPTMAAFVRQRVSPCRKSTGENCERLQRPVRAWYITVRLPVLRVEPQGLFERSNGGELADLQQQHSIVVMRFGILRGEFHRPSEVRTGFRQPILRDERE